MATTDLIQQFINQQAEINLYEALFSLAIAATLAFILRLIYIKFGTTLSNRKRFSNNFIIIATTTTLIISIIKSSLALSLGLVGSLSIIRFRTAIKDPEELGFIFIIVSIGLGTGANQWWLTIISFLFISLLLILRGITHKKGSINNLNLVISGKSTNRLTLKNMVRILNKYSSSINLKRFDKFEDEIEASFLIDLKTLNNLERVKDELTSLSKSIKITYLDSDI